MFHSKYMNAGSTEVSDIKILNLLSDCKEKLNIKASVELSQNSLTASPIMTGFIRPDIILPVGELKDKELSYIFIHELTHCRQKDLLYKWLIQFVVCIHWFNPFVYLLETEVNKACELACDEKVISLLDHKARREYGDTLISFIKTGNPYKSSLASLTLTEGAEQLKERLGAIINFKKKSKTIIAATAVFSTAICICFFAMGAYAVSGNKTTWKDREIQNEVLTEDGVYYIFCDGAEEKDKPQASVTAGNIQFVLVRKGSYTTVGPFPNSETLLEDVVKQCEQMKSLTAAEKELIMKTAAGIGGISSSSPSYAKLLTYKTENYLDQSVADFNAALASTPDELTELLAAQADVINTISPYDENYDFFATTMNLSTNELYCEKMGEEFTYFASISKMSWPLEELNEGEIMYDFNCFVDFQVTYSISKPELLTVAKREQTLLTFREEMQNYLDSLSEAEITAGAIDGSIKAALTDEAAKLADSLSGEAMTLSFEITLIDIADEGEIYAIQ
ncbi:regulatory protein BlaR1 [Lachnospiraceae bacterium]|nr:regulatory protein BlaR1 [Lachnospiraceae bacterium]